MSAPVKTDTAQSNGALSPAERAGIAPAFAAKFNEDRAPAPPAPLVGEVPPYPTDALRGAMRELVEAGAEAGLPAALVGGAALAGAAAAIGSKATIEPWSQRAILWVPLVAPRGAGKSPAQALAFGPLRGADTTTWREYRKATQTWEEAPKEERGPKPRPSEAVLISDATMEALVRTLDVRGGTLSVDADELATLLAGLGEYKRQSGDRGRLLALWTGDPWDYLRVGNGRDGRNEVEIHVEQPTVTICGGLQPARLGLLGGEEDGLRPRWLLHAADLPGDPGSGEAQAPPGWAATLGLLLGERPQARTWQLSEDARAAFDGHRRRWKAAARGPESASAAAALIKADVHLLRVALVLAEVESPGSGGIVPGEVVERAARLIDFTIDCWRAQREPGGMALTQQDRVLNDGVDRLGSWIEERGGRVRKRDAQRACAGGARTADDFKKLVRRYTDTYPGCGTDDGELLAPRFTHSESQ